MKAALLLCSLVACATPPNVSVVVSGATLSRSPTLSVELFVLSETARDGTLFGCDALLARTIEVNGKNTVQLIQPVIGPADETIDLPAIPPGRHIFYMRGFTEEQGLGSVNDRACADAQVISAGRVSTVQLRWE